MEESNMSKMSKILSVLKEKYKQMDNLMTLTKEMEKVIGINDPESLGAVLSMRQRTMDMIDDLNLEVAKILANMDNPYKDKTKLILSPTGDAALTLNNPLETNIFDTNKRILMLLQRIINLDDAIKKRLQ